MNTSDSTVILPKNDTSVKVVGKKRSVIKIELTQRYHINDLNILEAGLDEVARGCFFGPVYAGAVILDPKVPLHKWLNDSKKVTRKRRADVRKWIEETALAWSVASVDAVDIDKINIRNASMQAMNKALESLQPQPHFLTIDGDFFNANDRNKDIPFVTIVGGDAKYANIAAASILAKEHHDEYIRKLVELQPDLQEKYDILNNVGYGTPKHRAGLRLHGWNPHHRKTFLRNTLTPEILGTSVKQRPPLLLDTDDEDDAK